MNGNNLPTNEPTDDVPERYSRQVLYENIGRAGQRKLLDARVTLFGCGALGSIQAEMLVRAGLGYLRIIDRDFLEANNLQRQILFDEQDLADNLPKAEAARRKLSRVNSSVTVEAEVADANADNIERLAQGANLLADGTDNFETRFLINDLAVSTRRPWVYGAVIGATGLCLPIIPGRTPCLRCLLDEPPPPEMNPTCDTVGVLGPAAALVASMQALEVIKILTGRLEDVNRHLLAIDAWEGRFTNLNVSAAREKGHCPCCRQGRFDYLRGGRGSSSTTLCGRNAVQVNPPPGLRVDLPQIAAKLQSLASGPISVNRFLLKVRVGPHDLALFPDGRAIIRGTDRLEEAKALYARYIGA